jgi:hypothetical protein
MKAYVYCLIAFALGAGAAAFTIAALLTCPPLGAGSPSIACLVTAPLAVVMGAAVVIMTFYFVTWARRARQQEQRL